MGKAAVAVIVAACMVVKVVDKELSAENYDWLFVVTRTMMAQLGPRWK